MTTQAIASSQTLIVRIAAGPGAGRQVVLNARAVIGRDAPAAIAIPDPAISRTHAEIVPGPQGWALADLGSANGTRVDGRPSAAGMPIRLRPGSRIRIGSILLVVDDTPLPQVDGFTVTALLGRGSLGATWAGIDEQGHAVALKLAGDDALVLTRLHNGCPRQVEHPHAVPAWAVTGGAAMPLVDGGDLGEVLGGGPLPLERVLGVAGHLAAGLAALDRVGIHPAALHPGNVLRGTDGVWRVADAALAMPFGGGGLRDAYASPEALAGHAADARSTMYSFGAVLHRSLLGRLHDPGRPVLLDPAVHGDLLAVLLPRLLASDPVARPADWPSVRSALAGTMLAASQEDPVMRAASPSSAARSGRQAGQQGLSGKRPAVGKKPKPESERVRRRIPEWIWVVLGLLVIGAIALLATAPATR